MKLFKIVHFTRAAAFGIAASAAAFTAVAEVADGRAQVANRCVACHATEVPADNFQTVADKVGRKGPPLYYAGQKYQREWLTKWLQNPQRITPAGGDYWANSVEVTDDGDEVVVDELPQHFALSEADAKSVSGYLSTLTPYPHLMPAEEYSPKKVNSLLAKKDFRKFKGCASCHRDKADFGGVSGPELYTAMNRLQPRFIASYIRNPDAWDTRTIMPNKGLNDVSVQKLMDYLTQIKTEEAQP